MQNRMAGAFDYEQKHIKSKSYQKWRFEDCASDGLLAWRSDHRLEWLRRNQDVTRKGQQTTRENTGSAGLCPNQQLLLRGGYRSDGGPVFPPTDELWQDLRSRESIAGIRRRTGPGGEGVKILRLGCEPSAQAHL